MAPFTRSAKCMLLATAAAGCLFVADQVPQFGWLGRSDSEVRLVAEQAGSPAAAPDHRATSDSLPVAAADAAGPAAAAAAGSVAAAVAGGAAAADAAGTAWTSVAAATAAAGGPTAQAGAAQESHNVLAAVADEALAPDEDLESSAECKDLAGYNQTCLLRNVYWDPDMGSLHLHVLEGRELPRMMLNNWGGPLAGGSPRELRFPSQESLRHRAAQLAPRRRRGLTLYFQALWHHNWAHSTWDALYPAFVGLAKFGLHRERFLPVVLTPFEAPADCSDLTNMMCAMEQAYRLFGSLGDPTGELLRVHDALGKRWILFERLVVGSGAMGQLTAVLSLPATRDFKYLPPDQPLLPLFVERLYRAHGLPAPRRRRRSDEARPPGEKLKAVIIHNRRFGPELEVTLRASAEACTARCSGLEVRYLNWTTVQPFSRQLELLSETDIHVSSFGTALYTSLLLQDGSVSVNLGMADHPWHPGLPSYGEEFLALSHRGIRTLYMPLDRLRHGFSVEDVVELLEQAGKVIHGGFAVPVESDEENLSIFGKIILNLTRSSEVSRWGLEGWRRQDAAPTGTGDEAGAVLRLGNGSSMEYSPEDQTRCVPHRGHASPLVLESEPDFGTCHVDLDALRALKRDFGLKQALGVQQDCECVACQACGAFLPEP